MNIKDEINQINAQTEQIRQTKHEVQKIMGNFASEVDEYLKKG